jgi:hypothetical protein
LRFFFDGTLGHGVPGVLTMLAVPPMPSRVTCPSRGKQRLVTRCHCQHCAARFPRPASDRTKIFE